MHEEDSLPTVLSRLDAGDDDAATEIFQRFSGRLITLARNRLTAQERPKVDPEDVVQSVFRSFFVRQQQGQFTLAKWDNLWGLLTRMTLRKSGRRIESLRAACRDCRRDVSPHAMHQAGGDAWEASTREPTPEEVVALTETVEELMRDMTKLGHAILTMRLQGDSVQEIAGAFSQVSERKVYRVLDQVRKRLTQVFDENAS